MSMVPGPQKQLVARSLNGLRKQEGARGAPAAFPTLCNGNEHFESVRFSCRGLGGVVWQEHEACPVNAAVQDRLEGDVS